MIFAPSMIDKDGRFEFDAVGQVVNDGVIVWLTGVDEVDITGARSDVGFVNKSRVAADKWIGFLFPLEVAPYIFSKCGINRGSVLDSTLEDDDEPGESGKRGDFRDIGPESSCKVDDDVVDDCVNLVTEASFDDR